MKVLLVSSVLLVLAIVSLYVSASAIPEHPSISDEISLDENEYATSDEPTITNGTSVDDYLQQDLEERPSRVRRSCDCRRRSGECVSYGAYQCSSRVNAVIVQCLGYKWVRIGACPKSCRVLSNNQPYCF